MVTSPKPQAPSPKLQRKIKSQAPGMARWLRLGVWSFSGAWSLVLGASCVAADLRISDHQPLQLPEPGAYQLHILAPTLLELTLVTTKKPDPAPVEQWNFIDEKEKCHLPAARDFVVAA